MRPIPGSITLDGVPVSFRNPHEAQLAGISIIFQVFSLIRGFDVAENVFLNREPTRGLGHLDRRAARARTAQLLADIGIELDVTRRVDQLTVVQQQVVEIVKALSVDASVLIMDEPSVAHSPTRSCASSSRYPRAEDARGHRDLHLPHAGGDLPDRGPGNGPGRTQGLGRTRRLPSLPGDELVRMMVEGR